MKKDGTIHLVYQRQYYDDEDMDYFFINFTIFRNVPLSQLNRLNNKDFKQKVKEFCDKNYKDSASNFTNVSNIEIVMEKDYYTSFADIFADSMAEHEKERESKHMWTDYGQSNDRQSLRKDFNPAMTKSKVFSYNGRKCH